MWHTWRSAGERAVYRPPDRGGLDRSVPVKAPGLCAAADVGHPGALRFHASLSSSQRRTVRTGQTGDGRAVPRLGTRTDQMRRRPHRTPYRRCQRRISGLRGKNAPARVPERAFGADVPRISAARSRRPMFLIVVLRCRRYGSRYGRRSGVSVSPQLPRNITLTMSCAEHWRGHMSYMDSDYMLDNG